MSQEIWVICDDTSKCNADMSLGMITKAVELGKQAGYSVAAVCFGAQTKENMEDLFFYGIDYIVHMNRENVSIERYGRMLEEAIKEKGPKMIMFSASEAGRRMAAYTSVTFEAGLTAECIEIDVNTENAFEYRRAAINSSAIATIQCVNCELELCTIKENIFMPNRLSDQIPVVIQTFSYSDQIFQDVVEVATVFKREEKVTEHFDVNAAKVIFGMGRGIKDEETVQRLFKVAKKIGAEVVGTRAVVEDHMIEQFRQVGQSGISIAPEVYIAFGISGASQHMVGIKNAKLIIAVNTGENAPIFDYADYIIHEDAAKVLQEIERRYA